MRVIEKPDELSLLTLELMDVQRPVYETDLKRLTALTEHATNQDLATSMLTTLRLLVEAKAYAQRALAKAMRA